MKVQPMQVPVSMMMDESEDRAARGSIQILKASTVALGVFSLLLAAAASASSPFAGRGAEHAGRGSQGYLGINFRDVGDDQVAALKLKDARGEEVILVDHDGPACTAGLREHDVLLQLNGQPIESEDQLRRLLREMPAGHRVTFTLSREGQQQTLTIQLANRATVGQEAWDRHMTVPEPSGSFSGHTTGFLGGNAPTTADLPRRSMFGGVAGSGILSASYTGALLEMMGSQLAEYFGAPAGLLVRAVDPNSPAAVAGMRAGDVVVKIDTRPVLSGADWVKTVHENRGRPLSVVVLRDKKEQILTMTPDSKKRSSVAPQAWPLAAPTAEPAVGMLVAPGSMM